MDTSSAGGGTSGTSLNERRIEAAKKHVEKFWLPMNPELLEKIQDGAANGAYDLNPELVFSDLKSDIGLLTFCLHELSRSLPQQRSSIEEDQTMFVFTKEHIPYLSEILDRARQVSSHHVISSASRFQNERLREAMVSASAAEVLFEQHDEDPLAGFSAAIIRQLGHTLIAWNYPTVYRKSVQEYRRAGSQSTLDDILSHHLGFSPQLLAETLVSEWRIAPSLKELSRTPRGDTLGNQATSSSDEMLRKLIEVGEILARASHPETYPTASRDWDRARDSLQAELGTDGFKLIQERVRDNCEQYRSMLPETFRPTIRLDPESMLRSTREETIASTNQYVRHCPLPVRSKLEAVYAALSNRENPHELLRLILKEVIPVAGFTAGIIYTVDPGTMSLTQRLRFGTTQFGCPEDLAYHPNHLTNHPILTAFECSSPIVHNVGVGAGNEISFVAAALGNHQKIGVLYLELPSDVLNSAGDGDTLVMFKAIRQTLSDCLGLK